MEFILGVCECFNLKNKNSQEVKYHRIPNYIGKSKNELDEESEDVLPD